MNSEILNKLISQTMPFGKYKGKLYCDLPESYLVWFHQQGFPEGKLGELLGTMYEIRLNGLEYLLQELKKRR
ncbi:DUF3820 family protein [Pedobacter antarcticus]|uniref:DUF3820 family protein n=1 Tax=Pedobacter antarcticus TaxID=34086 RepID=UPI0008927280|nr:DUF3820 family protein [Pedobacter antarcticus]SDM77322.1 hypothetical protein SAMN04488084_11369 [Pedobacter antarcticus]